MKNILLVLFVAVLATSCKKEKLYNCLEGKWYIDNSSTTPTYIIDSKWHESIHNYNIDSDGYVTQNGIKTIKFSCNGSELTVCNDVQFGCESQLGYINSKYIKR